MDDRGPHRDGLSARDFSISADEVTCQQFVELITAFFEGTLDARTLSHVEEHLVMCDWCVIYMDQMEVTISSLGRLSDPPAAEPSEALLSVLLAKREGGR